MRIVLGGSRVVTRKEEEVQDGLVFHGESVVIPTYMRHTLNSQSIHHTWGSRDVYAERGNVCFGLT